MSTRGWENVSLTDIQQRQAPKKRSKMRNVPTVVDGERFQSGTEADWFQGLKAREKAGEIRNLQRQIKFPFYGVVMDERGLASTGRLVVVSEYVADAVYEECADDLWHFVVADKKGSKKTLTAMYKLKRKWLELQQGIVIQEVY